ncbi:hypothetical protein OFN97_06660 [Campylobacter sp. VBCF_05 NA6]|uniref:hypothetical protein n=1 Tax=unclassified Campylobacter TaxID=2593542 RepID=UPI0022E9D1B4|nr:MULTISPECIES: hypothetical protein [unclassified Campylobacter]MDA3058124.1 hypothetical protein [Campylobacter sp. VBCF_04 NA7]MDA3059695.1 hypothetical protein [Campylobacter sp. VBCF_05 NA6]
MKKILFSAFLLVFVNFAFAEQFKGQPRGVVDVNRTIKTVDWSEQPNKYDGIMKKFEVIIENAYDKDKKLHGNQRAWLKDTKELLSYTEFEHGKIKKDEIYFVKKMYWAMERGMINQEELAKNCFKKPIQQRIYNENGYGFREYECTGRHSCRLNEHCKEDFEYYLETEGFYIYSDNEKPLAHGVFRDYQIDFNLYETSGVFGTCLKSECEYKFGKRDGRCKIFSTKCELMEDDMYKNGEKELPY